MRPPRSSRSGPSLIEMARTRKSRSSLVQRLDQASQPIYLLDALRRIVFCNAACAEWLGREPAEIIGRRCDYHSETTPADSDRWAAGLCPPPEAFAGQRCHGTVVSDQVTGDPSSKTVDFIPLWAGDSEGGEILALARQEPPEAAAVPVTKTAGGVLPDATQLHEDLRRMRDRWAAEYELERLVGTSSAMERVREQVQLATMAVTRVVIVGPAGSGRERVARTIHAAQHEEGWLYLVPLACPLLDAELLESTVEAFLRGCAELSAEQPATLLLLDVDQLPEDAQASLLGLLRIAELRLHTLCTAQRSLLAPSSERPFRRELAYALSTLEMEIPPLMERIEDLPLLAQAAIEQVNARGNCQRTGLTEQALDCLLRYSWPGNVDELFQLLAEAHALASGPYLTPQDLPERIHAALAAAEYPHIQQESIQLDHYLADVERELLRRSLRVAKGNKAQAARQLGISRARLLRRMEVLQIS